MSYQAQINRVNPTLFVFLLDQSGSMSGAFGGQAAGISKANGVADAINRMLSNLTIRCSEGENIRDYFHISILGYGATEGEVAPALGGKFAGQEVFTISEIGNSPIEIEDRIQKQSDGVGGVIEAPAKFPIWFKPIAGVDTPMTEALRRAHKITDGWIQQHRGAFPPMVINITDGASTDGDPSAAARDLTNLSTDDGNVLFFNCHISSVGTTPILFPDSSANVPDENGKTMFEMSSKLTPAMVSQASGVGYSVNENSRGFVYQADLADMIRFLDIGTRPTVG